MNALFIIGTTISLIFFAAVLTKIIRKHKTLNNKITQAIFFVTLIYLVLAILSIIWSLETTKYTTQDFLTIFSICIIIQTLLLFRINHIIINHKRITYFFAIYVLISIITITTYSSLTPALILSLIMTLILSLELIFNKDELFLPGIYGIIYTAATITLTIASLLKINAYILIFSSLPLYLFLNSFLSTKPNQYPTQQKEKSYFMIILSHIAFVIALINFVLIGTIAIHEFGHYGIAKIYDCEYEKIVYENGLFYTEFICDDDTYTINTTLGGILLPIVIGLILFLIGGKFVKEIAILITGFNLIAIYKDLLSIGLSENIATMSATAGAIITIIGITLLTKIKSEELIYS